MWRVKIQRYNSFGRTVYGVQPHRKVTTNFYFSPTFPGQTKHLAKPLESNRNFRIIMVIMADKKGEGLWNVLNYRCK